MRFVNRIFWAVVFLFLLGFAVKNSGMVTLHFFFDTAWQLPLVAIVLIFFAGGTVVGLAAALTTVFRQRREIQRLKRQAPGQAEQAAP